ncbi:MAG: glycoside hydrolase family 38 C-terminal domain-containing protein [Microthrixaceae bacterium]
MFQQRLISERRLKRIRAELIRPNIWRRSLPFEVEAWAVPPVEGLASDPVPVVEALAADYSPLTSGSPWGAPWATTWFKFRAVIPEEFAGRPLDAILNLGFGGSGPGFSAEALIWAAGDDGTWIPDRGLHPMNHTVRVTDSAAAGEAVEFLVEAASNPMMLSFAPDPNSDVQTAGTDPIYRLGTCVLAVVETELQELERDFACVKGWMSELAPNEPRANELLVAIERSMDALDPLDPTGTASQARDALAAVLAVPAGQSAHRISAIGHAHIDSAWLWPIRETIRKCARTFSNVLRLMDEEPDFRFACSQAVQYEWMRQHYPSIFDKIRDAVGRGQWIPIGGQWVEADGNITGGESHVRQLLHGQRYFREHFGVTCSEVWIPDVFGYPAALPQIFRLGGAERFLTQKLSWNRTNSFPHHTFWWEGIDGSRVYTHFPPADNYNAEVTPRELAYAVHNFKEHGRSTRSLMPFGHGDGGGGPTAEMLARLKRSKNLDGAPRIEIESPEQFFDAAIAEYPDPPVWVGELYFETHRGSYTSQARTKVGNRRAEAALREVELWSVAAFGGSESEGYPLSELDELWKSVLLHQFHDILPGTSIGWVHREAEATHADVLARLAVLKDRALAGLTAEADGPFVVNSAPFGRDEVIAVERNLVPVGGQSQTQVLADGTAAMRIAAEPLGLAPLMPLGAVGAVRGTERSLENDILSVHFDDGGSVVSMVHLPTGREIVAPGERANRWQLHHDLPLEYDAWDIEEYYRNRVENLDTVESITLDDGGPLVARLRVQRTFRSSTLVEVFELRSGSARLDVKVELDWQERDHLLKVSWPLDLSASEVTRDIQYGHITTPIHTNTTWDVARFEFCAHKWVDLNEGDFGVALLNDGRYGHDATRTRSGDGSSSTTLRLSVVKGARFPDPKADVGEHRFTYSVMAHHGANRQDVIAESYKLNMPVTIFESGPSDRDTTDPAVDEADWSGGVGTGLDPVVSTNGGPAIVEVVKAAEDGSGDLILRVWEGLGNRSTTKLQFRFPLRSARLTDALEDGEPPLPAPTLEHPTLEHLSPDTVILALRPFQIATIRVSRADGQIE